MWKKSLLILTLSLAISSYSKACDACGCGIGSVYWGILPNNNLNYLGLWWQHQQFKTHLDHDDVLHPESREYFNTLELRGRFYLTDRLSVMGLVPVGFHRRQQLNEWINLNGLGDISLMANYRLINTADSLVGSIRHQLEIGAGVKLPTGAFRAIDAEEEVNPNWQLGSGSWDFLASANYTALMGKVGLQTNLTYKYNTTNADDYRFGHRLNGMLTLFYRQGNKALEWMPNVGLYGEWGDRDVQYGYWQTDTGGHLLMANAGVEFYMGRFNWGVSYLHPLEQEWSAGQVNARSRFSTHLSLYF